jgi:hypothetical protein
MNIRNFIIFLSFIVFNSGFSQTKSYGNYEVYSYEASRNGISYFTMDVNFPKYLNNYNFNQKGVMYTYQYFSGEIGLYNFANNFRLRFITESNFNIGGAFSSTNLNHSIENTLYEEEFKLYSAKLDIYSFDIGSEATYVFQNGIALTLKLGLNLFSVGASVVFPDGGKIKDDMFGVINLIPLILRPQFLVDFGRSVVGIGFIIHPKNFVEYKYVPTPLFDSNDKGIIFNDDFITSFAIQFLFHY